MYTFTPQNKISFEVLDIDLTPPGVVNYYIEDIGRTYLYFRVSTDKSVTVYYLLSLLGTQPPLPAEIMSAQIRATLGHKTDVMELIGQNSS